MLTFSDSLLDPIDSAVVGQNNVWRVRKLSFWTCCTVYCSYLAGESAEVSVSGGRDGEVGVRLHGANLVVGGTVLDQDAVLEPAEVWPGNNNLFY